MFKTIRNALKTPDVRKKLLYTLILIVVFRLGCYITVPGVDSFQLAEVLNNQGIASLIDLISGGAFSRLSIFAMSISPYITASIVIQLLGMVIPSLERLTKEGGEEGRNKINRYTKLLTVVLALIEGLGIYLSYRSSGIFVDTTFITGATVVLSLMAGTALLMWLGDQITSKGIGNGISIIIFVGIVAGLPSAITTIWNLIFGVGAFSTTGLLIALAIIIGAIILVAGVVFVQQAERRVPVQYSKRVVGRKMYGGQSTNIPIKVAAGGVMPIIFASSIMAFPATIVRLVSGGNMPTAGLGYYILGCLSAGYASAWWTSLVYAILYALLILFFTYFYSSIQFNPIELANNMKKSGGYIPGIRPGKPTSDYIGKISSRLNLVGAFFLAIIAILPVIVGAIFNVTALQIGGTSLLIMEGVALETVRQIESQMTMRHYKGFLE